MQEALPILSHREFLNADGNYEKAASMVHLVYVKDNDAGIARIKKGKKFIYVFDNKPLKGKREIERINKLAIPPAWTNVWICPLANGHIQATGVDMRRRKQYRYHSLWNLLRNETKFHHLYEFGTLLPQLRMKIESDIFLKELTAEKVLATVISLMERTYIRVGSNGYEKMYGSYGLTTLKDRHAIISGDKINFSFKGKKGIQHDVTLKNKRLAKIVKECRDIPGKELFQYYDAEGKRQSVDSGMVNSYIKEAMGGAFSAKDFRTWAGSLHALRAFVSVGETLTETGCKKNILSVLDIVSKKLGNTRMVCKKYYVHPRLLKLYEEKKLAKYTTELDALEKPDSTSGLTADEEALIKILKANPSSPG